ncbi:hypothetical protein PP631_gp031 [Streptomyces phage KimJongPhill]|jgi:hypothetical protein|uniref:Uncharacterized protein n=1 Tax=Streptomyces phage KimJongPhill TaxID=2848886 RepID=A0A8F2E6F2_9CAUD|nr:hypothetical protein PP631_gp031 [Streptomyces phage KimJongPhill]QWT29812.1 hypothetical protein SEA_KIMJONGPHILL_31 [Streptomyces phage KimJongPhill]
MKRAEYEAKAIEFRALLEEISQRPEEEREWPEHDEWLSIPGTSTCTTPTCAAFGIASPVKLHENGDGVFRAVCGLCDTPTNPVPIFEED